MLRSKFVVLVSLCTIGFGCSPDREPKLAAPKAPAPSADETAQRKIQESESARAPQSILPNRPYDVKSYALNGKFSWTDRTLVAEATIQFTSKIENLTTLDLDSAVEVEWVRDLSGKDLPFRVDGDSAILSVDISSLHVTGGVTEASKLSAIRVRYRKKANELGESAGAGLIAVLPQPSSGLDSPILYTKSEPISTRDWLPSNMDPSDRARFRVVLETSAAESLEASGRLVVDRQSADTRTMGYQTDYEVPPYLMAFAIGEFKSVESNKLGFPLRVVARKSFTQDLNAILEAHLGFFKVYQELLGPYPYEKYVALFLPSYPGGMEHVGISFMSDEWPSENMWAHELAHQWHGDLVTSATWNDLWIKEGMATLLAQEAQRGRRDRTRSPITFSRSFGISDGDAIIDPGLAPKDKYTSGPYGKAAFMHNQIRALVGEKNFWDTHKRILSENSYGALTSARYLGYFESMIEPAIFQKIKNALYTKALPEYEIKEAANGAFTFQVIEREDLLVLPTRIDIHRADGTQTTYGLAPGTPFTIQGSEIDFALFDPEGRSLDLLRQLTKESKEVFPKFSSVLFPKTDAIRKILDQNGVMQREMISYRTSRVAETPDSFDHLLANLDSEGAEVELLEKACAYSDAADGEWSRVIQNAFDRVNYIQFGGEGLAKCRPFLKSEQVSRVMNYRGTPTWRDLYGMLGLGFQDVGEVLDASTIEHFGQMDAVTQSMVIYVITGFGAKASKEDRAKIEEALAALGGTLTYASPLSEIVYFLGPKASEKAPFFSAIVRNHDLIPSVRKEAFCAIKQATEARASEWQALRAGMEEGADSTVKRLVAGEAAICKQ